MAAGTGGAHAVQRQRSLPAANGKNRSALAGCAASPGGTDRALSGADAADWRYCGYRNAVARLRGRWRRYSARGADCAVCLLRAGGVRSAGAGYWRISASGAGDRFRKTHHANHRARAGSLLRSGQRPEAGSRLVELKSGYLQLSSAALPCAGKYFIAG